MPHKSGCSTKIFKDFNALGQFIQAGQGKRRRLDPAMRSGLISFAISCGAKAAYVDETRATPVFVCTARSGKQFALEITGDPRAWLRAAASLMPSVEPQDAGLLRYLSASERVRHHPSPADSSAHPSAAVVPADTRSALNLAQLKLAA